MAVDTRVSLQKLEVFEAVVAIGGVTAAADQLGVAQPVVSAHLRSLEARMGTKLFYREGRRLHLTEAGRAVHAWAEDLLRRTRELSRDLDSVSDGLRGRVVIGTSMSIGSYRMAPILSEFLDTRPLVEVRVDMLPAAQAIEETESGENDLSFVVIQRPEETHVLTTELIGKERFVLVAAPDGPPDGDVVTPAEMVSLAYVEAQKGSLRRSFTDRALSALGLAERRVTVELGHPEAMKQMVRSGVGVSWLFESAVSRELADGTLREVRVEDFAIEGPVYFVHRTDKLFSRVHCDLVELCKARFAGAATTTPSVGTVPADGVTG